MPGYSDYIALLPTSKRIATPISKSDDGGVDIFNAPTLEGSDYEGNKNAQSFYYKSFYKVSPGVKVKYKFG